MSHRKNKQVLNFYIDHEIFEAMVTGLIMELEFLSIRVHVSHCINVWVYVFFNHPSRFGNSYIHIIFMYTYHIRIFFRCYMVFKILYHIMFLIFSVLYHIFYRILIIFCIVSNIILKKSYLNNCRANRPSKHLF